jgi:hypothetical protein
MKLVLSLSLLAFALSVPAIAPQVAANDVPSAEALWSQFHANKDPVTAADSMSVLDALFGFSGRIDATACAENAKLLAQALDQVPVSLALWYAEMECASAVADAPRQTRAEAYFSRLSRHALSNPPAPASDERPIPIVSEADAWVLAEALELEVLHAYFRLPLTGPYVRLQMTVNDPAEQTQRIWVFDAVESWRPLFVRDPDELSPAFAWRFRSAYMTPAEGEAESSAGLRLQRVVDALAVRDTSDLPRQLEVMAQTDFGAARAFFELCVVRNPGVCSHAAIDSLLRFAEAGSAEALWLLGTAYAEGRGVPRDAKVAAILLDRADARLGKSQATLAAAREWLLQYRLPALPPILKDRLEDMADAGLAEAAELLLADELSGLALKRVSPLQLQRYAAAADARDPRIRAHYAALLERSGAEAGLQALQALALQGESSAAAALLDSRRGRASLVSQPELRRKLHRLAGMHGRASSSAATARHLLSLGQRRAAQAWFYSAFIQGHLASGAHAVELAIEGGGLYGGSPELWARILDLIIEYEDSPQARRLLAMVLLEQGETLQPDPAKAGRLLRSRLGASDPDSKLVLAGALLQKRIAAKRGEDGEALLRSEVEAGNSRAMDSLALHISAGHVPGTAQQAVALWRQALELGDRPARNNLAWTLCTAADESYRDVHAGLAEAQALLVDARADDYLVLDILASCQAATGDFEGAAERLRDIIARLRMEGLQRNAVAYFEDKLARFERREAIIEDSRSAGPLARQRIRPEAQRALSNDRQTSTDPSS